MQNAKCRTFVGFSIKSKQILFGLDFVVVSKKVKYVYYTDSLGDSSKGKLLIYLERSKVPSTCITDAEMEWLISRQGCKVIGLTNGNMCKEIARITKDTSEVNE